MPINYRWFDDDKRIFFWEISDPWDWSEFHDAANESNKIVSSVPHTISVIIDVSDMSMTPSEMLVRSNDALEHSPVNIDMRYIIGANRYVRALFITFKKVFSSSKFRNKVLLLPTLEDALTHISADDDPPSMILS